MFRNIKIIAVLCLALTQFCVAFSYDSELAPYLPPSGVIDMTYYAVVTDAAGHAKYSIWLVNRTRMDAARCSRQGMRFNASHGAPIPDNYSGSGYDIGHLCPAQDMAWLPDAMQSTFDTINACPQTPRLNRGVWKSLETQCRKWALSGADLIIMSGPLYRSRPPPSIGRDAVPVPSHCWKIVINLTTRETLGYVMPNTPDVTGVPAQFQADPAVIKAEAGLSF